MPFFKAYNAGLPCCAPSCAFNAPAVFVPGVRICKHLVRNAAMFQQFRRFKKLTSLPISLILISFSISTTCCSSANANAHGTPNRSALVLSTNSALPPIPRPDLMYDVVVEKADEMYERVVGGIMSRRASRRSVRLSSMGKVSSSSDEISESALYMFRR
jgi:hypothetical protein